MELRSSHSITYISSRLFTTWQVWQKTFFCSLELEAFEKDLANAAVSFPMFSLSAFSSKKEKVSCNSLKIPQRTWTIFLEDSESETELQGHEVPAENARRNWQQNLCTDLLNAACHRICKAAVWTNVGNVIRHCSLKKYNNFITTFACLYHEYQYLRPQ